MFKYYYVENCETGLVEEIFDSQEEITKMVNESNGKYIQVSAWHDGIGKSLSKKNLEVNMKKPNDGFRDVLKRIKKHHIRSNINTF